MCDNLLSIEHILPMVFCVHCGKELPEPVTDFYPYCGKSTKIPPTEVIDTDSFVAPARGSTKIRKILDRVVTSNLF
jgi:hypothetical protein